MGAPTNAAYVKKVLANSEPSTHGGIAADIDTSRLIIPTGRVWRPRNVLQYLPRHAWQLGNPHHGLQQAQNGGYPPAGGRDQSGRLREGMLNRLNPVALTRLSNFLAKIHKRRKMEIGIFRSRKRGSTRVNRNRLMSKHHRETVEWKRALRDVGGLRESIALAFRDLGTLELSPADRLVIRKKIEAMTDDLDKQLEMFTGGTQG